MKNGGVGAALALAAELGFSIALPMVVFIGGGAWLDSKLHTSPWLTLIGVLLGVLSAGAAFYQVAIGQTSGPRTPPGRRPPGGAGGEGGGIGTNRADDPEGRGR